MNNQKTIKTTVWIYIYNCGDGSAIALFYPTEKASVERASKDEERYCDDIYSQVLEFDLDGNLLTKNSW